MQPPIETALASATTAEALLAMGRDASSVSTL
jgi:hypothetical protein